jgi:hypothetical protein
MGKIGMSDGTDQLSSTERAFPGGAPDIDPFGIEYEDIRIDAREGRTQCIETQRVIGRCKDRGISIRVAEPVETGCDRVPRPVYTPAGKEMVEPVGKGDRAGGSADAGSLFGCLLFTPGAPARECRWFLGAGTAAGRWCFHRDAPLVLPVHERTKHLFNHPAQVFHFHEREATDSSIFLPADKGKLIPAFYPCLFPDIFGKYHLSAIVDTQDRFHAASLCRAAPAGDIPGGVMSWLFWGHMNSHYNNDFSTYLYLSEKSEKTNFIER